MPSHYNIPKLLIIELNLVRKPTKFVIPAIHDCTVPHLDNHIILAMLRGHMEQGVSTHVDYVCLGPPHEKCLNDVGVAVHAGIMQRCKAMLIPAERIIR